MQKKEKKNRKLVGTSSASMSFFFSRLRNRTPSATAEAAVVTETASYATVREKRLELPLKAHAL